MGERPDSAGRGALVSWALYDWANQAFATVVQTFVFAVYFTRRVAADETTGTHLWGNAIAAGGIVVAVLAPVLGAVADRRGRRKPWLGAFMGLCVAATAALWFVRPDPAWTWPAMGLLALGTVGLQGSIVFYNAMLPGLASPDRIGRWSGWAWALGYAGGIASLGLVLFAFGRGEDSWFQVGGEAGQVRAMFPVVAVWILLFSLPLYFFTPDAVQAAREPVRRSVCEGLVQLRRTVRDVWHHKAIFRFLVARALYVDGLATIFAMGGVYAAGTFEMSEREILVFGLALNVSAGLGALGFSFIDDRIWSRRSIIASLMGLILAMGGALCSFTEGWFWFFGVSLGVFVGPVQASSRAYLSRLAPPGMRTQLFGFYALADKSTAFMGPLLVGWLTAMSGSQRVGMSVILLFLAGGLFVFRTVPGEAESGRCGSRGS